MVQKRKVTGFVYGYGLILGLAIVTAGLILVHGGSVLNFAFPVLAALVASVLISYRPTAYVAFVWYIWLFSPEVRRFVDYQTHYHSVSPVMITPVLVTGFGLLAVLRRPQFLLRRSMVPFTLLGLVFVYAFLVGSFGGGFLPAGFDFANSILPLGFGLFLMMQPENFAEKRASLVFAMILGLFLAGAYGLYQFFHFPPWDAYWLTNSNLSSQGQGVAEQVRLFGPLNSSAPYAVVLMSGLVFILVAKGPLRIAAGAAGFPAFGLASVREAWGGWVLAALFVIWRVGGKTRLWILSAAAVLVLIIAPLLTVGPVADIISKRFSSITNIQQDSSFQARRALFANTVDAAITQPIGIGFGQLGTASKLTTGQNTDFDSGLLIVPYEFGWFGTVLFVWAVGVISLRVFKISTSSKDKISIAAAGLFFGVIAQNIFASTFSGVSGLSLWIGVALALGPVAARRRVAAVRPITLLNQPAGSLR
jgi:hypothetical protein